MESGIQLIVGLGNPGVKYEKTRHNAGAWFISELADQFHAVLRKETKFQGMHCLAQVERKDCHLFIPTTFMNVSGLAVKAVTNFYKIEPKAILVAHDEIDLPVGEIRLKYEGGHGGHNGLRDIIQHLGTNQFYRLRIGVGRPLHGKDVADYVLEDPSRHERQEIDAGLVRANEILPFVLEGKIQKAMHLLHSKKD